MRRAIVLIVLTVFVIGLLTGAYIVVTGVSARPQPSTLEMRTAHAMRSIDDLDTVLTQTSPAILPRVDRPGSVLYALAKD